MFRSLFRFPIIHVPCLQKLTRLEAVHSQNFIHCDIKPENILVGDATQKNVLYLADFNTAHWYRDPRTHIHIPSHDGLPFVGTYAFASINCHLGHELSRRDDMESLAYLLVYLLHGSLPWFNTTRIRKSTILHTKQTVSADELCKSLPSEFLQFIEYSRNLSFTAKPDYARFRASFEDLGGRLGGAEIFDWQMLSSSPNILLRRSARRTDSKRQALNRYGFHTS